MRHVFLLASPLAVAPSAPRVCEAPGTAVLVASCGQALRLAPCRACALAPAVALAAVAAPAHQHRHAAARAGERPGAFLRVVLPCSSHAPGSQQRRATRALRLGHMDDPLCRLPYCTRTRGLHEWGAAAHKQLAGRRGSPRPSLQRTGSTASSPTMRSLCGSHRLWPPGNGGAGAQPQYKPSSIKSASGSVSANVNTPVRGIQPRAGRHRWLRAFNAFTH
jgi:hypothetical protein